MFSYPTPFTPPTTEDDRLSWLRLIRSRRVGVATFDRLLSEHGTATEALAALPHLAKQSGLSDYEPFSIDAAQREMRLGHRLGARLVLRGDAEYPKLLARITDAPPILWTIGNLEILSRPMVALIGSRNASSLGLRMTRRLAEGLGEAGFVIVSGLARGVDTAAHRAALPTGTVAVQAGGIDVVYPPENEGLTQEIGRQGLRLSEQPIGLEPQARHFPLRNRIISGLSQAVIVVEAATQSGSLITARAALDQGREVMAVPGHPFDARAGGCNALIRDGATLVRGPEDIMAALGLATGRAETDERVAEDSPSSPKVADGDIDPDHLLDRLGPSPLAEDQLIRDLARPAAEVVPLIVALELEGRILRQPGGLIARVV